MVSTVCKRMGGAFLALTSILFFTATSAFAGTPITVPANQPWTDTGIELAAGETVTVTASGTIFIGVGWPYETPDGQAWPGCAEIGGSGFLTPGLPCWSLVAQITTAGAPFEIGLAKTFTANSAGELYLGVNDNLFGDNSGSWAATVTFDKGQSGAYSNIAEYPVPTASSQPRGITTGPDGALWFCENGGNKIGRMTINWAFTEYPIPTANSEPYGITKGPDGALWFTEYSGNNIGRITTAGSITEYPIPTAGSDSQGITIGPDGALWFAEAQGGGNGKIGRITTAGAITEYPVPTFASQPTGITLGPDGALWFTEWNASKIGRITTAGAITEYALAPSSNPYWIVTGSDGALWFTENYSNQVGRITTAAAITQYPMPSASQPFGLAAGRDGALWFTEWSGNKIARITTTGVLTEYPIPSPSSVPNGITAGPDGALWFTQLDGNTLGRAPACGLGFSATYSGAILTMNFELGIDTPATFNILLHKSGGTVRPFSESISAVVPPKAFSMDWTVPDLSGAVVQPLLTTGSGEVMCSQWTTIGAP